MRKVPASFGNVGTINDHKYKSDLFSYEIMIGFGGLVLNWSVLVFLKLHLELE